MTTVRNITQREPQTTGITAGLRVEDTWVLDCLERTRQRAQFATLGFNDRDVSTWDSPSSPTREQLQYSHLLGLFNESMTPIEGCIRLTHAPDSSLRRPDELEKTVRILLKLDFCSAWVYQNTDWIFRPANELKWQVTREVPAMLRKALLEKKPHSSDDEIVDWDVQIEDLPPRPVKMIKVRFVCLGQAQPQIADNPLE